MLQLMCDNITLGYENNIVIKNFSLKVDKGEYIFILGENGSGKTTLMKALLGIISPLSGTVEQYVESIGYLPQQLPEKSDFPASVKEVVLSGCLKKGFRPFYTKAEQEKALENMKRLRIEDLSKRCFSELSGGQRQRVLLARALCAGKDMLLLDEPVSGLDSISVSEMYTIVSELNKSGVTVIMISHDKEAAKKYGSRIINIENPSDKME